MLSTALALLTACPQTADAQGFRFGRSSHRNSMQKKLEKLNQAQRYTRMVAQKKVNLDDWTEVDLDRNRKFRYVYGYDKDKNRTSETIYITRRENGQWGAEELLTVGTYVYEYDTKGQIRKKTVNYTSNDIFDSYYIETTPQQDGSKQYVRYEMSGDTYWRDEMWICRADGTLAEVRKYTGTDNEEYKAKFYNSLGELSGCLNKSGNWQTGIRVEGQLNDSTIHEINSSGILESNRYRYNAEFGRLAYTQYVYQGEEDKRTTYEYDAFGRLVKFTEIWFSSDDVVVPSPNSAPAQAATNDEDVEILTFTYAGDEVYGVNNPWRAVFGFEGPLASVHFVEKEAGKVIYEENNTFKRDASGKLLAVDLTSTGNPVGIKDSTAITVDPLGHISQIYYYSSESEDYENDGVVDYFYESKTVEDYTWENGVATRSVTHDTYKSKYGSDPETTSKETVTTNYTYTDNSFTEQSHSVREDDMGGKSETNELTTFKKEGKKLSIYSKNDYDETFFVMDVQNRDIKFERPNALVMNHDGFSPEPPVVVSVNGRVVAAKYSKTNLYDEGRYTYGEYELDMAGWGDNKVYLNQCENYLDVSDENGQKVCRNILGYPIYVIEGNRLVQEYEYYDLVSPSEPSTANTVRGIELPKGKGYELTTYSYNGKGLLVSKRQTYTDADGVTEELLNAEYHYDPTGIVDVTANSKVGATISGRNLSIGQGKFSVATPDGRILASEVSSYRLPEAGVYIVTANGASIKVYVK